MVTAIRDALEAVLLAGVKAWDLAISDDQVRDGLRCFDDDSELLAAADALVVPRDVLSSLPSLLEQHPGILDSEDARRAFHDASRGRAEAMVTEISETLDRLEPILRHEVDPDGFSAILSTLAYLAIERFCPEASKASQPAVLLGETTGYSLTRYAEDVAGAGWQLARKVYARIMVTELGQVIGRVIHRQARRVFTLLAAGDRQALAMILTQIMEEVQHGDGRTDSGGYEVDEEEARRGGTSPSA